MTNRTFRSSCAVMFLLFAVTLFGAGCGGGSSPSEDESPEPIPPTPKQTSYIVTFNSMGGSAIDEQEVAPGDLAKEPANPRKEGNTFIGWYPSEGFSFLFNFNTPISSDIVLYAKWWGNNDTTDTDGDGLIDSLEYSFGTDPNDPDTDDDGLTDWEELNWLNYNPLSKDTDGNGVDDGDEDADGDGLTNNLEGNYNTNMILSDTDHDGLNDYEEVTTHHTDPTNPDTDGDGVDDGTEVRIGSDPLKAETSFTSSVSTHRVDSGIASVDITVRMKSSADAAGTLTIREAERSDNVLVSQWIPGFLDAAYQIESGASFDTAEIEFSLSPEFGGETDLFKPRIYTLDDETGMVTELPNQRVEKGKIIAEVPHFSIYILLNKVEFDYVWDSTIKPPSDVTSPSGNKDATLDVVFVIDRSGSMNINDSKKLAIELPKQFIGKLRDGKDKAALVTFSYSSQIVSQLTDDKDALTQALDSIYYSGNTDGKDGLYDGVNILVNSSDADYKYVVFLTDGQDNVYSSHLYEATIRTASEDHIVIYTIGMGDAHESTLKEIAAGTGGEYYYAETGEQGLEGIFDNIQGETIDYNTDTNGDGISDYYTRLLAEGRMRIQNGTMANIARITLLSNDAVASRDWDGDGLPNNVEIEIRGGTASPYAFMKSDPTDEDTDGDGFTDAEEVNTMHTSPLKYTREYAQAVMGLRDDRIYPEMYIDFSTDPHEGDTWAFAWKMDEWARKAIMEYFTTYSTDITVRTKADYDEEYYALCNRWAEINGAASEVLSTISALISLTDTLKTLDPQIRQESKVQESLNKMEESKKKVEAAENQIIAAAQEDMKRQKSIKSQKMKDIENFQEKFSNSLNPLSDTLEALKKIYEDLEETEDIISQVAQRLGKVAQVSSVVLNIVNMTARTGNVVRRLPPVVKKWPLKFKNAEKLVSVGNKYAAFSDITGKIGAGITIATDVLDTVKDVLEIEQLRGQVEKNYSEFLKYIELLDYISTNYNYPKYVRDAALGLYETFLDANNPDWKRLNSELNKSLGTTMTRDGLKLAFDLLVLVPGPQQPILLIIDTVVSLLEAGANFGGFEDKAELIVKSHIYYAIADGSSHLIGRIIKYVGDNSDYYELLPENFQNFDKYAVQLAQGRLVGLKKILDYILDGSLAGLWDRGSHFLDILSGNDQAKKDEYQRNFSQRITLIHNFADILKLQLSSSKELP